MEFRKYKLGEIIEFKNGKKRPKENGNIPIYGGNGILGYTNKSNSQQNSIIIGRVGAYCGCVYKADNECWISDNAILGQVKDNTDYNFMYYLLSELNMNNYHIGSSQPLMTQEILNNFEVEVPEYQEQVKIGKLLTKFDRKIELNNQINDNLLEINKQLYKKWFIDFEFPNKDGKPYKFSGGRMIESELGEIPENWNCKYLEELVDIINGYSYKGKELVEESNIGMVTIKNFDRTGGFKLDGYKPLNPEKIKEQQTVELFDLVVAHTDLTQNADIIGNPVLILNKKDYEKLVISMDLVKVVPKNELYDKFYIFEILNSEKFKKHALGYVSGTTVLHLDKKCIKQYITVIPDSNIVEKFSKIIKINYEKISELIAENQTLEQLRDTLLPKLMNGEINLDNIEM